jgi:hypothetical protein
MELILHHLKHNIKTEIKSSNIDGIGIFAIKDIKVGEDVFPQWNYETGIYIIENNRFLEIPEEVQKIVDRYYISRVDGFRIIRLFKGQNFFYNSFCFCNSSYPTLENTNISNEGIALRDIQKGEEILEAYTENIIL